MTVRTFTRANFQQYSLAFVDKFILNTNLKLTFFVVALGGTFIRKLTFLNFVFPEYDGYLSEIQS
jgi:hypothetical protein